MVRAAFSFGGVTNDTATIRSAPRRGRHRQGAAERARRTGPADARHHRRQGRRRAARCATSDRETALLQHRAAYGERLGLDPAFVRRHLPRDPRRLGAPPARLAAGHARRRRGSRRCAVAFQGTEGAYGHEAAVPALRRASGASVTYKAVSARSARPLEAVQRRRRRPRPCCPSRTARPGRCTRSTTCCFQMNLSIVGEEVIEVRHCLLGPPGAALEGVTQVISHPQALAQCSEFLAERPGIEGVAAAEHRAGGAAGAPRTATSREAAIASDEAGDRYGLVVLARDIANQAVNLHPVRGRVGQRRWTATPDRRQGVAGLRRPATSTAPWSAA